MIQKVPIRRLFSSDTAEEFMFHYPKAESSKRISFSELEKHLQERMEEMGAKPHDQFLELTLNNVGYVRHAKDAFAQNRRILGAKEVMEQRVKYGSNPNVLGFLHELQDRRYNGFQPVFQRDYDTLCQDPELRWFIGLATSTGLIAGGEVKGMIIPNAHTLEAVAKGSVGAADHIYSKDFTELEHEGYLFKLPKQSHRDYDAASLYTMLADGDQKLATAYVETMLNIKFGSPGARREWEGTGVKNAIQERLQDAGYLCSAYSPIPSDIIHLCSLFPVNLKGFNSVLEFPGEYPRLRTQRSQDDVNRRVIRWYLPNPEKQLADRQVGIEAIGGCDPTDMRWDFRQLYDFVIPCAVVSVEDK